ncbi:hypothetical protein BY458DRAFT_487994 [Sporodiniella umbellata]|nr:hypothetical protein BY458DRAFT_487994 [Sporodiniella umbellata]
MSLATVTSDILELAHILLAYIVLVVAFSVKTVALVLMNYSISINHLSVGVLEYYGSIRKYLINLQKSFWITILHHLLNRVKLPDGLYLGCYVNRVKLPDGLYLGCYVNRVKLPDGLYLGCYVNRVKLPDECCLRYCVIQIAFVLFQTMNTYSEKTIALTSEWRKSVDHSLVKHSVRWVNLYYVKKSTGRSIEDNGFRANKRGKKAIAY